MFLKDGRNNTIVYIDLEARTDYDNGLCGDILFSNVLKLIDGLFRQGWFIAVGCLCHVSYGWWYGLILQHRKNCNNLCTLGLNTWISTINRVSHLSWWLLVDVLFAPGAAMWWYRAHFQARSLENLGPSKNFDVHPGRLTWNLRTHPWKRKIIWTIIFGFYIYLRGCRKRRVSCDTYCGSNGLLHCYTCPKSQCGMKDKGICSRVCLWAENLFNQCYAAPICEVMSVEIFFMEGNKSLQEITLRKTNMTMEN